MRASFKVFLIAFWLPSMMLLTTVPWLLKWEGGRRALCRLTIHATNRILGLHVKMEGAVASHRPLLLVSNHSSYLDIFALGGKLPIAFTPKKEIASWPVIGLCCRLAGCVFVERTPKAIARTKELIAQKLGKGRVMCIFAEGTTNDGTRLKPFKSSFFSIAEAHGVRIQPVAISYTHANRMPLDMAGRSQLAWYDDMALLPHLWRVLNYRRIDATIALLPLLERGTRKTLCAESEGVIKQALEQCDERTD